MSELGFQRQRWLEEQQRKFQLEDRQYVEDSIAGFRGFAPKGFDQFNGQQILPPARTDTSGLANFNPNQEGLMDQYSNKKPLAKALGGGGGY